MASASSVSEERDSYENQISEVKREIERRFRELIECLRERERKLLNELDAMLNTFKKARDKHKQTITELEQSLKFIQDTIKSESPKKIQNVITEEIESKRAAFSSEFSGKRISIELDESVLGLAENLGRVVVTECSAEVSIRAVVGYKWRRTPVLSVGGRASDEEGLFNRPHGVAVEYKTGNIYVADFINDRVQVFDSNGKYLYKFGDKMSLPYSITIHQDRVFVVQYSSHCVLVYELNGTFIKQLGSYGSGESQFKYPRGIAISEMNGDIYVCDCDNNRIQIFSKEFLFKSQFGQGTLRSPFDIKLTNEFICVLSSSQPFLYSFSYNFTPTHNSVLSSISKHLEYPHSFCIDRSGHFIISDYSLNAVVIFNQQGELVHTITDSVKEPRGVTLDSNGRIILVGENHCLLIF